MAVFVAQVAVFSTRGVAVIHIVCSCVLGSRRIFAPCRNDNTSVTNKGINLSGWVKPGGSIVFIGCINRFGFAVDVAAGIADADTVRLTFHVAGGNLGVIYINTEIISLMK